MTVRILALIFALVALASPAWAQEGPHVTARLIAEGAEVAPGGQIAVALEEDIAPGWHTYWLNPGAAGAATTLDWSLPQGWSAAPLSWPYPRRIATASLVDYGYEGKVWLLTTLKAPANATPGTALTLKAHASWLVCKDICIPEDRVLTLPLTIDASPSPPYSTVAEQFAEARAKLPSKAPWPVRFARHGGALDLFLAAPGLASARPRQAEFFPAQNGFIDTGVGQQLGFSPGGLVLRLGAGKKASAALNGVLVLTSADGSVQALDITARPGVVPDADFSQAGMGLGLAVLFALLGGLILNLMPCVLPILAMKAFAIASKAHADRREATREGIAYGAGSILSFVALGLAAALLRAGGEAVGWGFQLQSPMAVAAFALLLFAVGLNLSGLFELPGGISGGDALTRKGGALGAFFTGVLAVAVAAPCTAPFMAAALGFALTESVAAGLLVFFALGVGFAAPFVAIAFSPPLLRLLPKPGLWMLRLREGLAFPMYGAAAWLLWVLTQEAGPDGLIAALAAMIALAFAAWLWRISHHGRAAARAVGSGVALLALVAALGGIVYVGNGAATRPTNSPAAPAGLTAEAYDPALLAKLRQQGRPVFVDATAAWCITCLVNEKVALSDPAVRRAFKQRNVAYLVADWTNRNAAITRLLRDHGRSGVPLYLYYAPGAEAAVLPQLLTPDVVLAAIGK